MMEDKNKIKKLEELINKYADAYYNNNESLISDFEYDKLVEELNELYKKHGITPTKVGANPISKFSKVIMWIREDIRDDLVLIDATIVEDTKAIENKKKNEKERILIGEGIYLED